MSATDDVGMTDQLCPTDCWVQNLITFDPREDEKLYSRDRYQPRPSAVYVPLKPWQIRILRLEPGAADTAISIQLYTATLLLYAGVLLDETAENVTYEALSYSWGYGQEERVIQCNQIQMLVSLKVHTALRHLRHSDRHRFLWIDAICINQSDLHEKGQQVQRMLAIYFKAERVIAWLGSAAGLDVQALVWIKRYSERTRHRESCKYGLAQIRKSIETLCTHPWWRRVWIRQEVFAASDLVIHVEGGSIAFDEFKAQYRQAYEWTVGALDPAVAEDFRAQFPSLPGVLDSPPLVKRGNRVHAAFLALQHHTATMTDDPDLSLDAVLRGSINYRATDSRDYIYGVVSMTSTKTHTLANPTHQDYSQSLRLDYNLSLAEVLLDVTYNLIASHQCLDVIYLAHETRAAESLLPTWCPDWTRLKDQVSLDIVWAFQEISDDYVADGCTLTEGRWVADIATEGRSRLGGYLLFPSRAVEDVLVAARMNTAARYPDSRFLHCVGSPLGILSAVREDDRQYDYWRSDDDGVWSVRW